MRFLWLGWLVACSGGREPTSEWAPSTLAVARVTPDEDLEGTRSDALGTLSVDGDGLDQDLVVQSDSGGLGLRLQSPASPDLSAFDGTEVLMSVREERGGFSLALRDAAGVPLYLLEPVTMGSLAGEVLGAGLVGRANDLGPANDQAFEVTILSAWLRTDTGDVELFPGQPAEVTIEGGAYRAVLLAGYEVDVFPSGCSGEREHLAFELLKVEAGSVDTGKLERPATLGFVDAVCIPVG